MKCAFTFFFKILRFYQFECGTFGICLHPSKNSERAHLQVLFTEVIELSFFIEFALESYQTNKYLINCRQNFTVGHMNNVYFFVTRSFSL
jgi:hypothetical protein